MTNTNIALSIYDACQVYEYAIRKQLSFTDAALQNHSKKYDIVYFEKEPYAKKGTPVKFQFYALFLCLGGELTRHINQYSYHIKKGSLHLVPPEALYFFENITETSEVSVIYFTEEFITSKLHCSPIIREILEYHQTHFEAITFTKGILIEIKWLFHEIEKELLSKSSEYISIIQLSITKLLLLLKRGKQLQNTRIDSTPKPVKLAEDYLELVEKNYLTLSQISDYAKLLGVTPKYLGEIVNQLLGNNALSYIHNRKLKEALYLLRFSNLKYIEIAQYLSFLSQSDFNRFFKKHYNMTPKKFREHYKVTMRNFDKINSLALH